MDKEITISSRSSRISNNLDIKYIAQYIGEQHRWQFIKNSKTTQIINFNSSITNS